MSTPRSNTTQIELERTPPLCDRCRNPALTVVEKLVSIFQVAGYYSQRRLQLAFCGHDYTVNEALLVLGGWVLVADTRAQLANREAWRRAGGLR